MPKKEKKVKQSKKDKSLNSSKSVEVKVNVPITKTSFTTLVLILLLSLVGFSGYLGVKSVWNFTHPQFNVSLDSFKALGYIAKGQIVPPQALSDFFDEYGPDELSKKAFTDSLTDFKKEFREKFNNSRLNQIQNNEFLNLAASFCEAKEKAIKETGKYSAPQIIKDHQSKFILRYPGVKGLNEFVAGVGQRAFDNLCKDN